MNLTKVILGCLKKTFTNYHPVQRKLFGVGGGGGMGGGMGGGGGGGRGGGGGGGGGYSIFKQPISNTVLLVLPWAS